ncbi:hypothetical protein HD596_007792 [Nonomuraea jabiensis]|uniref:Tn3 transposase DDE domain-containing protein n=1 Tax=Nonomuraea jabiensis TaxID=882448 RepID=A0A7W9GC44_9ACTN|nr:hypothetical protein [Nonomuraea jabiensis]
MFGIFSMLGYRFADLGDRRFWRADLPDGTGSSYGPLEVIALSHQRGTCSDGSCAITPARPQTAVGAGVRRRERQKG